MRRQSRPGCLLLPAAIRAPGREHLCQCRPRPGRRNSLAGWRSPRHRQLLRCRGPLRARRRSAISNVLHDPENSSIASATATPERRGSVDRRSGVTGGRRMNVQKTAVPRGACQERPPRPRPAVCSPLTTAVRSRAPNMREAPGDVHRAGHGVVAVNEPVRFPGHESGRSGAASLIRRSRKRRRDAASSRRRVKRRRRKR